MAKKTSNIDQTMQWGDAISKAFDKQREIDHKLSPHKYQLQYIMSTAKSIYEHAHTMEIASNMAHEGLIDFAMAQRIMDVQNRRIIREMKHLKEYLPEIDKEV